MKTKDILEMLARFSDLKARENGEDIVAGSAKKTAFNFSLIEK